MSQHMSSKKTLQSSLKRRTFLKAMGLGAGSLMLPSLARSDEPLITPPKRVVFMMSELGWNPFDFRMKPAGAPDSVLHRSMAHPDYANQPDDLSWEIDLTRTAKEDYSKTLEPLHAVKEYATVLDGLGMLSIGLDGLGDAHAKGWVHALSGHPSGEYITGQKAKGGAASIDLRIARFLREQNPNLTDLTALHFYINDAWWGGGVSGFHHFFHDKTETGQIVKHPTEANPQRVFERLFPGGMLDPESVEARGNRKILETLGARYDSLFPNLSSRDRQRLDLHRQTIADIKRRIEVLGASQCAVPDAPINVNGMPGDVAYQQNIDTFFDLATTAFSCDLTRVIGIEFRNSGAIQTSPMGYNSNGENFHEYYSHSMKMYTHWRPQGANATEEEYNKFQIAAPVLGNKNRFHVSQAVRLAEKLRSIPEGDGNMLDNTLIMVADELTTGSHTHDQWPVVLIGGFGGSIRPGRYIRYPRVNPASGLQRFRYSSPFVGVPHNQLLISICQGMGMPIDDLGVKSVTGRFSGLGVKEISLTGPLPGFV